MNSQPPLPLQNILLAALPTLSITATAATKPEGQSGVTAFTFMVKRTTGTTASSVSWSVVHGSTNRLDFDGSTSGVLNFAATELSRTITVYAVGDILAESNETFSIQLSDPVNATLGTASASSTITNDDKPRLSIAASVPSVSEGTSTGSTPYSFTVTRDVGSGASSVKWAVAHRGTNAQDFLGATSGTLNFADGETTKVITVNVAAEAVIEGDESFAVQLSAPTNAVLATASATATITNDDTHTLKIVAATPSKQEGTSTTATTPFSFTVTRSAGAGTSTVNWGVAHVTTTEADFSGLTSGTLSFATGETSKTITVNVVGDKVTEAAEAFNVQLSAPANATIVNGLASATIVNDDLPSLSIAASSASLAEGSLGNNNDTVFTFTVTRSSDIGVSSADWALQHRTTTALDFVGPTTGTVIFTDGQTSQTIRVRVAADTIIEADEVFAVQLSAPDGATLDAKSATATILNDDLPTLSIAPPTVARVKEGSVGTTTITFIVTRSSNLGSSSATWNVVHGTTTAADFSGNISGTVSFSNTQVSRPITVKLVGDTVYEEDETFSFVLSQPAGARISTAAAPVTVLNDDPAPPRLSIAATSARLPEGTLASGSTAFTFTVTRDTSVGASSASWAVGHRGTHAQDFVGNTSGTVSFANGENSKTITVQVAAEAVVELDEAFVVELSNPVNALLVTASATATIVNDDVHAIGLVASSTRQPEGDSGTTPVTFTVTRTAGVGASSVAWAIEHGTTSTVDFSGPTSGIIEFASGETSRTITVNVIGDTALEADEAFSVRLSDPVGAQLASNTSVAFTIINDDTLPPSVLDIAAATTSQVEGQSSTTAFTFTVTRSSDSGSASATWTLRPGTANAEDFSGATTGVVSFAAGETSRTITVNVVGDTTVEREETFSVQLSNPVGTTIGTTSAAATILNDDLPILTLTNPSWGAIEGQAITYQITRNADIGISRVSYHVETKEAIGPFTLDVLQTYGIDAQPIDADNPLVVSLADFYRYQTASADDFTGDISGQVTFSDGEVSKVITINLANDSIPEANELFRFYLHDLQGATLQTLEPHPDNPLFWHSVPGDTPLWRRVVIGDNDPQALHIAANQTRQIEGTGGTTPFTFTITRDSGIGPQEVWWSRSNGSANDADFIGPNFGIVHFANGETSQTITINVVGDSTIEADETFRVHVQSSLLNWDIEPIASATIVNDDIPSPPTLSIAATNATQAEGDSGTTPFTFTVTRSHSFGESSVGYQVNPFGASTDDFAAGTLSGNVRFAEGETSQVITVNVLGDTVAEGDEMFLINLGGPVNATVDVSSAQGTILDDDVMASPNFAGSLTSSPVVTGFSRPATPLHGNATASTILAAPSGRSSTDFGVVATAA